MIKRVVTLIIAIVLIALGCVMIVQGQEINTYNVVITTNDDAISVVESLTVDSESSENMYFWIQDNPSDLTFIINGDEVEYNQPLIPNANTYSCNISGLDTANIEITYDLDLDINEFIKTLQYNTSSITITYDETEIYSSTNLKIGSTINVALVKESEGETTTVETIPTWVYGVIVVLIILLIVAFMRPTKKQKSAKKKETSGGSEELLTARKAMLMEILKEIEKRHRSKQISDDTYHKLKDEFKQDAVETMRKLDDLK